MNQAHLHLLLNHIPVLGTIFGVFILVLGYLLKHAAIKQTALYVFIVSALFAVPAYLTGEGAEEVLEGFSGVSESFIEPHEDLASVYIWIVGSLGVLSLLGLVFDLRKSILTSYVYMIILGVSLVSIGISAKLGSTGGEIRHTEIRKDAVTQTNFNDGGEEEND